MIKNENIPAAALEAFFKESMEKYKDTELEDKLFVVWNYLADNLTSFLSKEWE